MRSPVGEGHDFVVDSVRCGKPLEVREQKEAVCCITGVQSCSLAACYCLILRCIRAYLHIREHTESRKKRNVIWKRNWSGPFCRVGAQFDFGDLTFPFRGRLPRSKQSHSSYG